MRLLRLVVTQTYLLAFLPLLVHSVVQTQYLGSPRPLRHPHAQYISSSHIVSYSRSMNRPLLTPQDRPRAKIAYFVSLTTASTDLAKYSTLFVFRPAMLMRPFFVM